MPLVRPLSDTLMSNLLKQSQYQGNPKKLISFICEALSKHPWNAEYKTAGNIGLLPAWFVLASPINKNKFVVRLGRKSFLICRPAASRERYLPQLWDSQYFCFLCLQTLFASGRSLKRNSSKRQYKKLSPHFQNKTVRRFQNTLIRKLACIS